MKPEPPLAQLSIPDLEVAYEEASLRYGEAIDGGKYKMANKQNDRILSLRKELWRRGSEGRTAIHRLMQHQSPWVRLLAAGFALRFDPQSALSVLRAIADNPRGLCSFTAETVLQEWAKGNIAFDE